MKLSCFDQDVNPVRESIRHMEQRATLSFEKPDIRVSSVEFELLFVLSLIVYLNS